MHISQTLKKFRVELLFTVSMCWLYGTYAARANPVGDDWWIIDKINQSSSFVDLLDYWMKTVTHRPVYAVLLATFGWIFKAHVWAYVLLTSAVWCSGVVITAQTLRTFMTYRERWFFAFLACTPILSSSTLFASIQLIASTFAFFFWAISFRYQVKGINESGWKSLLTSFVFCVLSMLTYEATLPLIGLSFAIVFVDTKWRTGRMIVNAVKAFLLAWPQWGTLIFIALFKISMHFLYPDFLLKMEGRSWIERILSIGDWCLATFVSFPIFLISTLSHRLTLETLQMPASVLSILLAALIPFVFHQNIGPAENVPMRRRLGFLLAVSICILSSFSIFVLSGYGARIEGLGTRLWAGTWILISVLAAIILSRIAIRRNGAYLASGIFALVTLSYCVQMRAYINSSDLAVQVTDTLYSLLKKQNYMQGDLVVGNVPRYIPDNLNNEPILEEVYLEHAIRARYPEQHWNAVGICPPVVIVEEKTPIPKGYMDASYINWKNDAINVYRPVGNVWSCPTSGAVWFYDYDFVTNKGTLDKLASSDELKVRLDGLNKFSGNRFKKTFTERFRDWLKMNASSLVPLGRSHSAN